jgi:hypothetical protein
VHVTRPYGTRFQRISNGGGVRGAGTGLALRACVSDEDRLNRACRYWMLAIMLLHLVCLFLMHEADVAEPTEADSVYAASAVPPPSTVL